ncbi:MAG: hypothetical protein K2I79_02955, partial [Clostridia bacterium]|nr:hypothetical protein [Clostridia bacterium]
IKLRSEVENARAMSAVESAKMQAMAEIERAKNEAKFAMHSGNISEAAATTVNNKAGAGDVLGDALMSAVAKMIVQGSINGASNGALSNTLNNAQPMPDNANSNVQNNANAIPQCPPGGRMTTTTMVDMTNTGSSGNIINPTNPPRSGGRSNSAVKSGGVNGNPFEVDGLYKKYYDDKGANDSLLKPHEHGLYEKYYDDEQ